MAKVVMIPKYPDEKETGTEQICPACSNSNPVDCNVCEGRGYIFSNVKIDEHKEGLSVTREEAISQRNDSDSSASPEDVNKELVRRPLRKFLYLLLFLLLLFAIYYLFKNNSKSTQPNLVKEDAIDKELKVPKLKLTIPKAEQPKPKLNPKTKAVASNVTNIDLDKIDKNWQFYGEKITKSMLKSSKVDWSNLTKDDIVNVTPRLKKTVKSFCKEQSQKGYECYPALIGHPVLKNRAYKRIGEKVLKMKREGKN